MCMCCIDFDAGKMTLLEVGAALSEPNAKILDEEHTSEVVKRQAEFIKAVRKDMSAD